MAWEKKETEQNARAATRSTHVVYRCGRFSTRDLLVSIGLGRQHRLDIVERLRQPECTAPNCAAPHNCALYSRRVRDQLLDSTLQEDERECVSCVT